MGYLQQMAQGASPMGAPPAGPNVGTPPPLPSTDPPPYDVLQDPAWAGMVHPNEHAWRSFLNELSPEHRQMLLQKANQLKSGGRAAAPPMPAGPPPSAAPPMPGM
jgi:hypothetical protein